MLNISTNMYYAPRTESLKGDIKVRQSKLRECVVLDFFIFSFLRFKCVFKGKSGNMI